MNETNRIVCTAVLLACALAAPLAGGVNQWTPRPLERGGRITDIVVAPGNDDLVWAASDSGGIFRSETAGRAWVQANEGLSEWTVLALTVSPDDADILYAGTGSGRIFKSRDGGKSWAEVRHEPAGEVFDILALSDGVVLALTEYGGMSRSTDGGESWVSGTTVCRAHYPLKRSSSGRVACGAYPAALSDDGGRTWRDIRVDRAVSAVAFGPDGAIYVAAPSGILRSVDGGSKWQLFASRPADPLFIRDLLVSRSGMLFASTESGVWGYRNQKWTSVLPSSEATITSLAAGSASSERVYAASTEDGVFTALESDSSWTNVVRGMTNAPISDLAISPFDPSRIFAVVDEVLYRSDDPAGNWTPLREGVLPWVTASAEAPSVVYTGGQAGIFRSSDAGETWTSIHVEASYALEVSRSDPATLYTALIQKGMAISESAGHTWTEIQSNMPFGYYNLFYGFDADIAIDPVDPATVYVSQVEGLFKTTNRGATWERLGSCDRLAIDVHKPATLYCIFPTSYVPPGSPSGLSRSDDGGRTWVAASPEVLNVNHIVVDPSRSGVLYATSGENVHQSRDYGETWTAIGDSLAGHLLWPMEIDASGHYLYAGTTAGVYEYEVSAVDVIPAAVLPESGSMLAALLERSLGSGAAFVIPVAGLVRGGAGLYRTDLRITNRLDRPQDILLAWLPRDGSGGMSLYRVGVPAHSEVDPDGFGVPNIVGRLGLEGAGTIVAIAVDPSGGFDPEGSIDGNSRLCAHATDRNRNPVCETLSSVRLDRIAPQATATGLRFDADVRANVGIANLGAHERRFMIAADGERRRETFEVVVPGFALVQRAVPAGDYGLLTLRVSAEGASAPWLFYGSSVENRTGAAATVVGTP